MRGRVSLLTVTAGLNLGETRGHLQMTQHLQYSRKGDKIENKSSADVARRFCDRNKVFKKKLKERNRRKPGRDDKNYE